MALAALTGDKILDELAQQFGIHPNQITTWKQQLSEYATEVFNRKGATEPVVYLKSLHAKIVGLAKSLEADVSIFLTY